MKKQWAIVDKKSNHEVSIFNTKDEAEFTIEKYMHKDEFEVQEHIPFDGNEGIFARGDVSISEKFKTRK
jgi:hypothetical protein